MRRHGFDFLIVIAAAAAALEAVLRQDTPQAPDLPAWLTAATLALLICALLARGRAPFVAPAAVWLASAALSFADGRLIPYTASVNAAGMAAAFLLGRLRDRRQSQIGLVIVVSSAVIVMVNNPDSSPGDVVLLPLVFALAWLAGFALRERAEQAERAEERAANAERVAAAEERARIARELHDIVAHSVSVMVLQVGAVRHRLPASEDRDALEGVEQTGRAALGEMRQLLGALRREGDETLAPQPGLDGLDHLLTQFRGAGLPVDLRIDGEPFALPGAVNLSAYRIVQEGLTNTLKHAHASAAQVVIAYAPDELSVEVRDDGVGGHVNGTGHGLVGVRERVRIYGGEMSAGAADGGGFLLRARLPLS